VPRPARTHKTRYRYILENFEKNWNDADATQRIVRFTMLAPRGLCVPCAGPHQSRNVEREWPLGSHPDPAALVGLVAFQGSVRSVDMPGALGRSTESACDKWQAG
jgi:hypothetical protein